jgi:DNA-directed RNA polymerase sigma subunit (sigma70/sigma32)
VSSHHHHGVTASSSTTGGGGTVGTALTSDDLLHEGTIGLAEAIDRHNILLHLNNNNTTAQYSSNNTTTTTTRLSTYATYWIRARILRAMHNRGEHALLRFPEHVIQASHRLVKSAKLLGLEWEDVVDMVLVDTNDGEEDTTKLGIQTRILRDRLCRLANIPIKSNLFQDAVRARCMSKVGQYTTSLESWMTDDASSSLLEDVVDDNDEDNTSSITIESYDDDETLRGDETQVIVGGGGGHNIVNTLSKFLIPREIEVLSLRYGLIPPTSSNADEEEMGGSSIQVIEKKKNAIVDGQYCNDKQQQQQQQQQPQQQQQQQQHQQSQQPPLVFHDYETEAMDGLFGPQGMLSHYNTVASSPTFTNNEGVASTIVTTTTVPAAIAVAVPTTTISKTTTFASSSMEMQSLSKTTLSAASQLCNGGELSSGMIIPTTPPSSSSPISSRSSSSSKSINNNNNNNGKQQTLLSFKEIGKHMKFSSEYCRRTCSVALNKLTRAVEEGRLVESDFLLGW